MQECAETLAREQNLRSIEDRIASVKEIFRLQGASELQDAEERYLPKESQASRAIILAASRGSALGTLTDERPKAMVEVRGQPLLGHIVSAYNASGIKDITVVRGYRPEAVNLPALKYVDNPDFADTSELLSLDCALKAAAGHWEIRTQGDLYVSFGDVIFKRYILDSLAEAGGRFCHRRRYGLECVGESRPCGRLCALFRTVFAPCVLSGRHAGGRRRGARR